MESDIEQKQTLLKAEIIDKNYDQEKFITFCTQKKPNGDDLTQWTYAELQEIIEEFKKQQSPEASAETQPTVDEKITSAQPQTQDIKNDIQNIKSTKTKIEDKTTSTVVVQCKKLEKTPLNETKGVKVVIKNPKPVETGFLSSNYVNYEVETAAMQWLVRRRYSDFEWLRTVLIKYNPGQVVPPLPNKKIGSRRFEVDFIEKRMMFLQKFIDAVLLSDYFKASEPLISFLSMTDRPQFEAKMKELSSYQPSPYIEEFKTFSGTVTISSGEEDENEKYFTNINNYFRIQTQLFDRLNFNLKSFYNNLGAACTSLEDVQKDFETLHLLNTRVLMKEQITKSFEELGIFIKNWKRILYKQNEIVKVHLKDFFKFIKMEGTSYEELIKSREEVKAKYVNEKVRLTAKKEKLYAANDTTKWEIIDEFNKVNQDLLKKDKNYALSVMCTRETKILENLKKRLGFANRTNIEELKNMIKINCAKYMSNLKSFTEEFYPSLTDGINVYSSVQMFVAQYAN